MNLKNLFPPIYPPSIRRKMRLYDLEAKAVYTGLTPTEEREKLFEITCDEQLSHQFYSEIDLLIAQWRDVEMNNFGTHTESHAVNLPANDPRRDTGQLREHKDFTVENFDAGFNGRSGGHLVLYYWNGYNYGGTGLPTARYDLEELEYDDLKWHYDAVKAFDRLYDELIAFTHAAAQADIYEEEYTYTEARVARELVL